MDANSVGIDLPYRPMARIALDIDSTLHHYWDLLDRVAQERFGVELPYDEQSDWGITVLGHDQLVEAVRETHSDDNIAAGVAYPGAVETVRAWHDAGHWIHITSHRSTKAQAATERWLEEIALPYDDLHCSYDKVTRCVELNIDLLIDDSPVNIQRAKEVGIPSATILHPWNAHVVDDGVIGAKDWKELRAKLEQFLSTEH